MARRYAFLNPIQRFFFYPIRNFLIRFFPRLFLSWQYRFITGHPLNLKSPTRYTEKLQYLRWKVYPFDPLVIRVTDRVGLRDYVQEQGFEDHLIPLQGVYQKGSDIPFHHLQRPYVIKATHGSNMNHFVFSEEDENMPLIQAKIKQWLATNYGKKTLELHYSPIQPRIIIESFLKSSTRFPVEYKLHVFHGKVKFLYVVTNRGGDIRYTLFDRDWKSFDGAQFNGWIKSDQIIEKPASFNQMISMAEKLGTPFPFVRVDLYDVVDKIYVSELTFTPAKGTLRLDDDTYDVLIGSWLNIHEKQ